MFFSIKYKVNLCYESILFYILFLDNVLFIKKY
ncbi:hypothetical protein FTH_1188 [Francisella tularensis subsp. holarctica OSU18]|nr:hypothetical protein FTH_1188 [Francisella tularensis subsp. holarctica OSU18]